MIRILIASEQNSVREIKSLLNKDPDLKAIAVVRDGRSAVKQVDILSPDIVLLDLEMPIMDGITAAKYINHLYPDTKVIIFSSHEDKKYVVQSLMAGARAYILKHSLKKDLKQIVLAVNSGYCQIESKLLAKIFRPANSQKHSLSSTTTHSQAKNLSNLDRAAGKTEKEPTTIASEPQSIIKLTKATSLPASKRESEAKISPSIKESTSNRITDYPKPNTQNKQLDKERILLAPKHHSNITKPTNTSTSSKVKRTATTSEFQEYWQQAIVRQQLERNSSKSRHRLSMAVIKSRLKNNWILYIGCVLLGTIIITVLQSL